MRATITTSGHGVGIHATKALRQAGLVKDDPKTVDGEYQLNVTHRETCRCHAFDGCCLIVGTTTNSDAAEAKLVSTAARDTKTAYCAIETTPSVSGNGYRINVPGTDAGWGDGDTVAVRSVNGAVFVVEDEPGGQRLADDLAAVWDDARQY